MINRTASLSIIKLVANILGSLNEKVAYVGGAVVGLYANDPAADDVRPTKDVDITLEIASYTELAKLESELNIKGFKRDPMEKVNCRFFKDEIILDVMSTKEVGWAPANRWFEPGFNSIQEIPIDDIFIKILPLSYFLASKFEAFHGRGSVDPRTSKDFEDITYVLNNTLEIKEKLAMLNDDVKEYLKAEFTELLKNESLQEAMLGNLDSSTQTERLNIINKKLQEIIDDFQ